ncbi:class I SAM-dependent methyltransferase [Vibrio sp.]|uniref:Methyltransferase domain-containing protein n=1 Tax=Vibrio viridaestus TaxID=2487322 RepID=A0A3N9TCQ7_9VIBR|nr:class I SAM-dependent methyltransferase [Vibrio viridaestus]MDC0611200.1 class I SAM-dependent methyltransferase [Vibrio sp.]RQW61463.1 methyltransferase domain-containing protein [Vibrio viridaestus]
MSDCPLCHSDQIHHYHTDKSREYWQCKRCELVFVGSDYLLPEKDEKSFYDLHENDIYDERYRRFLSRVYEPISNRVAADASGLDFGCGPGPALAHMFQESGKQMSLYDIYYYPDVSSLERQYDFMVSTEVIEHIFEPDIVWKSWLKLVKPGGWIGLMTKLVKDVDAFATWHYKSDLTHVRFYSRNTFEYLAERDQLELEFIGNDVILFKVPEL